MAKNENVEEALTRDTSLTAALMSGARINLGAHSLTPELIDSIGKNDREFLTHQVKVLLDVRAKLPNESLENIAKLVDTKSCGRGCCCCCDTIVIPGEAVFTGK